MKESLYYLTNLQRLELDLSENKLGDNPMNLKYLKDGF